MKVALKSISIIYLATLFSFACTTAPEGVAEPNVEEGDGRFTIIDRTGKRWDVSHAFQNYQMNPDEFQFGVGPNAIRPILNPRHLEPGQSGYPADHSTFLILGTTLENETRAYSIDKLSFHEVADEKFGDVHVAVAY